MSLKVFHIVFITVSILLSFGMAAYAWFEVENGLRLVWVALAILVGVGLILYGRAFLKKIGEIQGE